jgi:hypothetical protein
MAYVPLIGGNGIGNTSFNFNTTTYAPPAWGGASGTAWSTTEANRYVTWRTAGTWAQLLVLITANTIATSASTLKSRINTADGNQSVSIAAGATGTFEDATNSDTVSAGDELAVKLTTPNTSGSITLNGIVSWFNATTNSVSKSSANLSTASPSSGSTGYRNLCGSQNNNPVEGRSETLIGAAGTLKNLFVNITANSRAVVDTWTVRVSGASTGITVSSTASTTGILEDTSNTAAVVAGDTVTIMQAWGASAASITWDAALELETTNNSTWLPANQGGTSLGTSLTRYWPPAGTGVNATEANTALTFRRAGTLSYGYVFLVTNGITATSTFRTRINGANGNITVSVGSGATGQFTDTSNTDAVAVGDLINWQTVTGASGSTMTVAGMSLTWTTRPAPPFLGAPRPLRFFVRR